MIDFEKQTEQSASDPSPETLSLPEAFLTRMQGLLIDPFRIVFSVLISMIRALIAW
jgi:hypothetical protein